MSVYWDTGIGSCWHCGENIQLHTYKKKADAPHIKPQATPRLQERKPETYKKPEASEQCKMDNRPPKFLQYWAGRCISEKTLAEFKVHFGNEWMPQTKASMPVICFPYFEKGEHINTKYRGEYASPETGKKQRAFKLVKDAKKIPYNLDAIASSKQCLIVEGEPDVLSFSEAGYKTVCSGPNGSTEKGVNLDWLDNSIDYFSNKDIIYLGLDNDAAGQNIQAELIRRLGSERIRLLVYPEGCKDGNDVLTKQGADALLQLIDEAVEVPLNDVLPAEQLHEKLMQFYLSGLKGGLKTGTLPNLDEVFSVYTGQYIVWTGVPTHGKSEQVDQYVLGMCINNNLKAAYCSVENRPTEVHCDKILRKITGKRINTSNLYDDKVKRGLSWIYRNIYFIEKTEKTFTRDEVSRYTFDFDEMCQNSGYTLESVLAAAAELVQRKGIRILVLDPYNKIPMKTAKGIIGSPQYTTEYLSAIDVFCRKFSVLIILVAHPTKMQKEQGVYEVPNMYNIKGGGEFYDMAYHGIVTYRCLQSNTVLTGVLKCKFAHLGENGAEVRYRYCLDSGRYHALTGDESVPIGDRRTSYDNRDWLDTDISQQETVEMAEATISSDFWETASEAAF